MRYLLLILLFSCTAHASDAVPAVPASDAGVAPAVPVPDAGVVPAVPASDVTVVASDATPAPVGGSSGAPDPEPDSVPKVPETDEEAGTLIGLLLDAAQHGHWTVAAGLLLLLLMWLFNRMGLAAKIGRNYVPWAVVTVSAVGFVAVGLATGASVLDSLKVGLLEGGVAIALWELIFKRFTAVRADGTLRTED